MYIIVIKIEDTSFLLQLYFWGFPSHAIQSYNHNSVPTVLENHGKPWKMKK